MKDILELIAKELVDHPEEVQVTEKKDLDAWVLHLSVAKDDMGKVIGRGGRIANSMRKILSAFAARNGVQKVILNIG